MTFSPSLKMTKKYKLENNLNIEDKRGYNMPDFGQARRMIVDRYTAAYGEPKSEVELYAKELSNFKCFSCGKTLFDKETGKRIEEAHFDHIRPAANFNLYCKGNAAIMCRTCNTSKGSKDMLDYYNERVENGLPVFFTREELNLILDSNFKLYRSNHPLIADFGEKIRLGLVTEEEIIEFFYTEILSKVTFFKGEGQDIMWGKRPSDLHIDNVFWSSIRERVLSDSVNSTLNKVERIFTLSSKSIYLYNELELINILNEIRSLIEYEVKTPIGINHIFTEILIELDRPQVGRLLDKPIIINDDNNKDWWDKTISGLSEMTSPNEISFIRNIKNGFDTIGRDILNVPSKSSAYLITSICEEYKLNYSDEALVDRAMSKFFDYTKLDEIAKYVCNGRYLEHKDEEFFNELIEHSNKKNKTTMRKIKDKYTRNQEVSIFTESPQQLISFLIEVTEGSDGAGVVITDLLTSIGNKKNNIEAVNRIDSPWTVKLLEDVDFWVEIYNQGPSNLNLSEVITVGKHFIDDELNLNSAMTAIKKEYNEGNLSRSGARYISKAIGDEVGFPYPIIVYNYDDNPMSFSIDELDPLIENSDSVKWRKFLSLRRQSAESKRAMNIVIMNMFLNDIKSIESLNSYELKSIVNYDELRKNIKYEINAISKFFNLE